MGRGPKQKTKAIKKTTMALQRRAMVDRLKKKKVIDTSTAAHILGMKLSESMKYIKDNILKKASSPEQ